MTTMLQFLGRLHILVLHLPIGFLVLAFLMELAARRTAPALRPAVGFTLRWGMASAVLAAGLGYFGDRWPVRCAVFPA